MNLNRKKLDNLSLIIVLNLLNKLITNQQKKLNC